MNYNDNSFKKSSDELPESSFCYSCLQRDTCQIKEYAAIEERTVITNTQYLSVSVMCKKYKKDGRVKNKPPISEFARIVYY